MSGSRFSVDSCKIAHLGNYRFSPVFSVAHNGPEQLAENLFTLTYSCLRGSCAHNINHPLSTDRSYSRWHNGLSFHVLCRIGVADALQSGIKLQYFHRLIKQGSRRPFIRLHNGDELIWSWGPIVSPMLTPVTSN
jgi:hypothetical protein